MPSKKVTKANGVSIAGEDELFVMHNWDPTRTFTQAVEGVQVYSDLSKDKLSKIATKILTGKCIPASLFDSSERDNKKIISQKFANNYYPYIGYKTPLRYIGLPAGASIETMNRYGCAPYSVSIFERDLDAFYYIRMVTIPALASRMSIRHNRGIQTRYGDILDYFNLNLPTNTSKFNVFDLDLMCQLDMDKILAISNGIKQLGTKKIIVNVVTSYGHKLTKKRYEEVLRPLLRQELGTYYQVDKHEFGTYCDRRIPMAYEHFCLSR